MKPTEALKEASALAVGCIGQNAVADSHICIALPMFMWTEAKYMEKKTLKLLHS